MKHIVNIILIVIYYIRLAARRRGKPSRRTRLVKTIPVGYGCAARINHTLRLRGVGKQAEPYHRAKVSHVRNSYLCHKR